MPLKPWSIVAVAANGTFRIGSFANQNDAVDRLRFIQKAMPSINFWLEFCHPGFHPSSHPKSEEA